MNQKLKKKSDLLFKILKCHLLCENSHDHLLKIIIASSSERVVYSFIASILPLLANIEISCLLIMGWIVSPKIHMLKSKPLVPLNVTIWR